MTNTTRPPAPGLELHQVYALAPAGQDELSSGTTLSSVELDLLIRFDGALTLAQIKAGMPAVALEVFMQTCASLRDRRLVSLAEIDPISLEFDAYLDKFALAKGEAEANAGMRSLKSSGYYVGIARRRQCARVRVQGETLSAVVVEDEPTLARFIQSYLAFDGFSVRIAANRAAVVAELSKRPIPDLILLDVALPDVDGFDVLVRLRQHKVLQHVSVIMLTGAATREAVLKGIACGADGYITKPFQPESLMSAVRTVVGLAEDSTPPVADPWVNRDALSQRPTPPSKLT